MNPSSSRPLVLVVEDEPALREVTRMHFENQGCRVMTAASAEEALAKFKQADVDLVFTDMRLGGMSGEGLIARVIALKPEVHAVATSALLEELDRVRDQWGRRVRYLMKPYRRVDLEAVVAVEVGGAAAMEG